MAGTPSRVVWGGRQIDAAVLRHGVEGLEITMRSLRGVHDGVHLPLIGRHQAMNAAMAIAAVEALAEDGIPYGAVREGLSRVQWPGRLEVIPQRPVVILDGAHNPQALHALGDAMEELWSDRTIHLLVGMSSDKSVEAIAARLAPRIASITCTRSHHPRAADPALLARQLAGAHQRIEVIPDPIDACTYVLNQAAPTDVVVITGSLFLVGELRSVILRYASKEALLR
jgi:dihydrofolate synthase/folylpolyglutamate synthase